MRDTESGPDLLRHMGIDLGGDVDVEAPTLRDVPLLETERAESREGGDREETRGT